MKTSIIFISTLVWTILLRPVAFCQELPETHIIINPVDLTRLNNDPYTDEYFPAVLLHEEQEYDCDVRFRGKSSRNLAKKSWRIRFNNNDNPFNKQVINLNAEYRDKSQMRNHLTFRLFQYFNYPAPNTEHINFYVNDEYMGVFLQLEDVDDEFLRRNSRVSGNLYKALNHGALMSPLLDYRKYPETWEKIIGHAMVFNDIQLLFSKIHHWDKIDFQSSIESEIDVQMVLQYFAITFAVVSFDCFTKNMFLYFNGDKQVWELFPWDNDATFGNTWRGDYEPSLESFYNGSLLPNHTLFQRLIEYEEWQNDFWTYVNETIYQGFDFIKNEIDSTYQYIRDDVYQDQYKTCSNTAFDQSIDQMKQFLDIRREFVKSCIPFDRQPLFDFSCSPPYLFWNEKWIQFQARSEVSQPVTIKYIRNLDWTQFGDSYTIEQLQLFDDGAHNDGSAGDLIYGNRLELLSSQQNIIPFCFNASGYDYPANGLGYINYIPTRTNALVVTDSNNDLLSGLTFGNIYHCNEDNFIELVNLTNQDLDLSLTNFNTKSYYINFPLPPNCILQKNDTLILTSNQLASQYFFPEKSAIGNIFWKTDVGDTIKLFSPVMTPILETVCHEFQYFEPDTSRIIINEINYHSGNVFDTGDWVELYNPNSHDVSLCNWYLKDENDDNMFLCQSDMIIQSKEYIVICEDKLTFCQIYPDGNNIFGDLNFKLSNGGDRVRLYNRNNCLIDSLCFDDKPPWPEKPDGYGATLELIDPAMNNTLAVSWAASLNQGTPGRINSVRNDGDDNPIHTTPLIIIGQNCPNPFNQSTTISYSSIGHIRELELNIYNVKGQRVHTIKQVNDTDNVLWENTTLSSGIYFYQLTDRNQQSKIKKAIILN